MLTTGIVAVACALALQVEGAHSTQKGDGGEAVGIGQMHVEAVQEVNRILGYQAFKLADRENPVCDDANTRRDGHQRHILGL